MGPRGTGAGDSAGDLAFGLSQLLLPEICQDPMNNPIWCGNRKFLTNGARLPSG